MNAQRGFTLVEAMVVLSIIVILAGVGIPAMQDFLSSQRVKSAASELFSDILQARSEAIKRNTDVTLAPVGSWNGGWTIANPVDGQPALASHAAPNRVTINGPVSLVYTSEGRVRGAANPKFDFSSPDGKKRCIVVDLGGRPTVQPRACGG
ncbi:MAG TPA: GspH/FimT family pseudopilin [Pseudoduganella sp.]